MTKRVWVGLFSGALAVFCGEALTRAQQTQITRLSAQIKVIQASVSTNGNGVEVRPLRAKMSVAQQ